MLVLTAVVGKAEELDVAVGVGWSELDVDIGGGDVMVA